jgi:hypothetical protein
MRAKLPDAGFDGSLLEKPVAEVNCAGVYRLNYEYDSKGRLARVSQGRASGN